ncbi:hypothetical protein BDN71DRAFT_1437077 [Pleurotus eryngii]|uniref:DUF6532 domain-containing protein n=1 Tax=Pleurotus eryngii TaxID=5323 RepID=A0A9P6D031_PLEER|nr:hypothetical protein BDN71DRAFT_1437077 [Pleurotus eryngii]
MFRSHKKREIETLIPTLYTPEELNNIGKLLEEQAYIYPWTMAGINTSKIYQARIVIPAVTVVFFGPGDPGHLYYPSHFKSSCQDHPNELEINPLMVAMAMTLVEISLREKQIDAVIELKGDNYDNSFKSHMVRLLEARRANISYYHKLMCKILNSAKGSDHLNTDTESTRARVIANVDWEKLTLSD